jgi:hypothetical protein
MREGYGAGVARTAQRLRRVGGPWRSPRGRAQSSQGSNRFVSESSTVVPAPDPQPRRRVAVGATSQAAPACRSSRLPPPLAKPPRPLIRGSVNRRHTEVFDRVAGSSARLAIQSRPRRSPTPPGVRIRPRDRAPTGRRRCAPTPSPAIQSSTQSIDGRVDRLPLEDALDELPLGGQPEDLRQRPVGNVALQPLHRPGPEHQHPVRGLPAHHLLPGEGRRIESVPRAGPCAKAAEVASQIVSPLRPAGITSPEGTRTPEVVPFQVKTTSRSQSRAAMSTIRP